MSDTPGSAWRAPTGRCAMARLCRRWTAAAASSSPTAWLAFGLAVAQALSGALVVTTRLSLFSTLGHAAIMALLFAALAWLTRRVLVPVGSVSAESRLGPRDYTYNEAAGLGTVAEQ